MAQNLDYGNSLQLCLNCPVKGLAPTNRGNLSYKFLLFLQNKFNLFHIIYLLKLILGSSYFSGCVRAPSGHHLRQGINLFLWRLFQKARPFLNKEKCVQNKENKE